MLTAFVTGGVPTKEVITALTSAMGINESIPILIWTHAAHEQPIDAAEPLRSILAHGILELQRSALMLHMFAICDQRFRASIGRSMAYDRYRSVQWTLQDWPYTSKEDFVRITRRGLLSEEEASTLADFSTELHLLLEKFSHTDPHFNSAEFCEELDHLGARTLSRLAIKDQATALFRLPAGPSADQ
jgi:hypothetical protein